MTNKHPFSMLNGAGQSAALPPAGGIAPRLPFDFRARQMESNALPPEIQAVLDKPVSWFKEDAQRKPAPGEAPLTHVGLILDKSGSMETGKSVTIEGFNTQLNVIRAGAAEVGETRVTFTQFSDAVEVGYAAAGVEFVQALTDANYRPGGYTALYDAIGDTLATLLRQLRIDSPACATLVTIFTDGEENASRRYSPEVLRALIERLEASGRWTFALVGPRDGVTGLAQLLSVNKSNITGFDPGSVSSRKSAMGLMAGASMSYMACRSAGETQAFGLYSDATKPPKG